MKKDSLPVSELLVTLKNNKFDKDPICEGRVPVKEFPPRIRVDTCKRYSRAIGIVPVNLLVEMSRDPKAVRQPTFIVSVPVPVRKRDRCKIKETNALDR